MGFISTAGALLALVTALSLGYYYASVGDSLEFKIDPALYMEKNLSAFVLGGTGAVGQAIIKALAEAPQFTKVTLIGRRQVALPTPVEDARYDKFDERIIDFEKLPEHSDAFKGYDVGFCSLGTTRAQAGAEGFYRVDHDYVVNSAKLAKTGGCKHYHLVSSAGANKNAWALYSKTKGEVEDELTQLDFSKLSIYRPALLLVDEREHARYFEGFFRAVLKPLDHWRCLSVDVPLLGKVIVANTFRSGGNKAEILTNGDINKFGKDLAAEK